MSVVIIHALRGDAGPTASTHNSSTPHSHVGTVYTVSSSKNYTHTRARAFNGPFSGTTTTRVSRYQKGKTNLDFTEARGSEWQWHQLAHMQVCTSFQPNNYASTPPLSFLQAGCPSCRQTDSVKALKAIIQQENCKKNNCAGVSGQRRRSEGPRREGPRGRRGRGHGEQPAR